MAHDGTITVADLAPLSYGKGLPERDRNAGGTIPVYGSNGIVGYHDKPLTNGPTIIVGRKGTVGALHYSVAPCWPIDTTFFYSDTDNDLVRYRYFALKMLGLEHMNADSAVPGLNRDAAHARVLRDFSEDEQRAIAHILGTLDDKIELNRRMNETLEAIAWAIFKSWFVDFDPVRAKASGEAPESICRRLGLTPDLLNLFPDRLVDSELGEIPEGWEWSSIGDQVDIVGGGTPSTRESEYWDDGAYNWTTPKDLSGNPDKVLLRTERKITQKGLETISSGLLPAGTVLMSSRAPVGYLAIAKVPTAINQGFIAMKCHKLLTPEYALQWANSVMDEIKQRASGTTFAEISKKNFRLIKVLVPTADVVHEYTIIAQGLYGRITSNVAESDSFSEIRDSLLPKLLSGELLIAETINE